MKKAWLFGAGSAMKTTLDSIGGGYNIKGVLDNSPNKWGKRFNGYECFAPTSVTILPNDLVIISSFFETEIAKQLVDMGVPKGNIRGYSATVKPQESDPEVMMEHPTALFDAYCVLSDRESKEYYAHLIKTRFTKNPTDMIINPNVDGWYSYSGMDGVDVVLDCGANVGNSARHFLDEGASRVVAIEPEMDNLSKIHTNLISEINVGNVIVEGGAVGAYNGFCRLELGNACGQHRVFEEPGDTPMFTIDSLDLKACDLIKMDIEGSELAALKGGRETIDKYRPHLAISTYHKPCDIYELPLYISKFHQFYRIYVGQLKYNNIGFAGNANEQIMYCIGR